MERVDSRKLDKYDAYLRRFGRPGLYHYSINYLGEELAGFQSGPRYEIAVKKSPLPDGINKPEQATQHDVQVVYDPELRYFCAIPTRVEIESGDLVMWHKPGREGGAYWISGSSEEKDGFDSRRLGQATVYMHTFLEVGMYQYTNVYGKGKGQSGTVKVVAAGEDRQKWSEALNQPAVVTYAKGAFVPSKVEIVEGGSVMWVNADDVSTSVVMEPTRAARRMVRVTVGRAMRRR